MHPPAIDGSKLWIGLLSAAFLSLAPLAWLQYRWTGEIARADRDRLRASLHDASNAFVRDFDEQLNRLVQALLLAPPDPEQDAAASLANRFAVLKEAGISTRPVRDLLILEPDAGPGRPARAARFDPEHRRFVRMAWTAELESIARSIASESDRPQLPGPAILIEQGDLLAIAQPAPPPGPPNGEEGGIRALQLDRRFILDDILPRLVERHFRTSPEPVAIRIVRGRPPARVEFQSDPAAPMHLFERPDAVAGLFSLAVQPPGRHSLPPFRRAGGFEGDGGPPDPPALRPPVAHPWMVEAAYRNRSLDSIVASARWRNLALSLGILFMLTVSLTVLLVATRRAQRLAHLQMEFVAGVSHELRTPLSVISSAGDNLADGVVSSEQQMRRYGVLIRGEARRLTHMVEQILRFAGLESGRIHVSLEPLAVETVLREAIRACDSEVAAANCTLEDRIPADLPPVLADARSLLYACRNLIHNAAIHAGGGGWIGVQAAHDDARGTVSIRVSDRGPGIARSEHKHIFEPFYRGRRAVEDQIHGFGLGLALVKRVVTALNGTITVESEPGRGASFIIRLPAAAGENPHESA
ncbi:MAG: HAMP domain-containing sensor histidine kinase [Acidobacteria bacterium]|nr:HAMP domain-containing sensor histidine kinase [Acidobacteriota bacterium]